MLADYSCREAAELAATRAPAIVAFGSKAVDLAAFRPALTLKLANHWFVASLAARSAYCSLLGSALRRRRGHRSESRKP